MAEQYPIFMDLKNKLCVVVGAGEVAGRKITALLKAGASVRVIGRRATDWIKQSALADQLEWIDRDFKPTDVNDAILVIAATDDLEINTRVYSEAEKQGILVNVVDQPDLCSFLVPSVVARGRLQVAISTGGSSPALARHLRERFEVEIGPEYADYLEVVRLFRRRVQDKITDAAGRKQAYKRLFASDLLDKVKQGSSVDVESLVNKYASGN